MTDSAAEKGFERLNALRQSGAITQADYERLVRAIYEPAQKSEAQSGPGLQPQATQRSTPSLLGLAAAAGGGALAGSLAADMIQSSLAQPAPEILEAHVETTTTWSDDGYVSETDVTWENADGEVVAEDTYVEQGTFVTPTEEFDQGDVSDTDSFSFEL